MGYLCANFGLPRPICSPLRPDVRDRLQTSDRRRTLDRRQIASSLNAVMEMQYAAARQVSNAGRGGAGT